MSEALELVQDAKPRRFRPYPQYKDSGVEWLGKIPAHWETAVLKRGAKRIQTGTTPPTAENRYYEDGTIPWYGPGSFAQDLPLQTPTKMIADSAVQDGVARLFEADSTAIVTIGATIGKVGYMECQGSCNQQITVVAFDLAQVHPTFGAYQLKRLEPVLAGIAPSTTLPIMDQEEVGYLPVVVPPPSEQPAIAAFLDRETAKIDALVARKERLIELLQEKRTALITRAVTRGLAPTNSQGANLNAGRQAGGPKGEGMDSPSSVPTKDSGVEWLGEIPAHWEMIPLKRGMNYVEGPGIMAADFTVDGVPLLRIAGIGGRKATLDGCNYVSPESVLRKWNHFRVRTGDLLISGSASTGFCTEVDEMTEGAVPYTGIIIIRPRIGTTDKGFVRWLLLSDVFLTQAELARSGSTIQHFGPSHLSRMVIVVPPAAEQRRIADRLDRETAKIDALVAKVREAIERLQEFRTALISAAVTGKIDVREEAA